METFKKVISIIFSGKVAAVIGVLSFILALYTTFWLEKSGDITASISPMYKIFDMHRDIGGLEVTLNGESLKKAKKTVWISKIKIENTGNTSIKKSDFDDKFPLTINISGGNLVENINITASSEYLMQSLNIHGGDTKIVLSPAIIEPKDFVIINFLILGKESDPPSIKLDGKIAGIKSFKLFEEDASKSFYFADEILKVNRWWIHIVRALFYFVIINAVIIILTIVISFIWNNIEKYHARYKRDIERMGRKNKISKIKKWDSSDLSALINIYINGGELHLSALCNALDSIVKVNQLKRTLVRIIPQDKFEDVFNRIFLVLGGTRLGMTLVKRLKVQVYEADIKRIMSLKNDADKLLEDITMQGD